MSRTDHQPIFDRITVIRSSFDRARPLEKQRLTWYNVAALKKKGRMLRRGARKGGYAFTVFRSR